MADQVGLLALSKVAHHHTALGARDKERRARGLLRGHQKSQLVDGRVEIASILLDLHALEVEGAEAEAETVVLRAFFYWYHHYGSAY